MYIRYFYGAKSSMGTAFVHSHGPLDCFGLNNVNGSAKRFLTYLSINNLAVVTMLFKKS